MLNSNSGEAGLDLSVALAHVENDLQLLAELAAMFVQDYPRLLRETRNFIELKDYSGLERAAHTLKGRLAFFGVRRIREQALQLEMMGRKQDLAGALDVLAAIEAGMKSVLPEMESLAKEI